MKLAIKISTIIAAITMLNVQSSAFGQVIVNKQAILSGSFTYIQRDLPDSIMIMSSPKKNYWDETVNYMSGVNKNGNFKISVPVGNEPLLFEIIFFKSVNGKQENVIKMGAFYAEPDDNVQMKIYDNKIHSRFTTKDSIVFTGYGSAKYNAIEKLNQQFAEYSKHRKRPKELLSTDVVNKYLNDEYIITKEFMAKKYLLLDTTKNINDRMKDILSYQYSPYDSFWVMDTYFLYNSLKKDPIAQNYVKLFINKHFNNLKKKPTNENSLFCPFYYQVTNMALKYKELINSESAKVNLKDYYNTLRTSYSGKIREKMLAELFKGAYGMSDLTNFNPSVYDSLISDANKYMTSQAGHEIIRQKLKFKNGSQVFKSEFMDLQGKSFNLSSLIGKVYIIDVWGLGCSACAGFHYKFEKELWPILKHNSEFAMLTINVDKTRENWIRGIESKEYTSEEYINVSSLPLTFSNPFFKYYTINYAPFLLLVDKKGNIVSNFRPGISSKDLLEMINHAIGKDMPSK